MMPHSEVRQGSFIWKTPNFLNTGNANIKSTTFIFGRYKCYLQLSIPTCVSNSGYGYTTSSTKEVHLITDNTYTVDMFSEDTLYALCLMDRHGKEFLIKCGKMRRERKGIVMILYAEYLRDHLNELAESGNFTFCLTWAPRNNTNVRIPILYRPLLQHGTTQTTPDLKSEKDPTNLLEILSNDFKCIYESQTDTDCVLKVGETQFHVHRTVLSARSTVFSAMFRHDTSESRVGEVDIQDAEATSVENVLHYIYSGKIRGLDEDTAVPMYTLADKYAIMELKNICLQFLMHNLTTDNVCDVAVLAHTHAECELEERVVDFIEGRLDDFEESEKWIQLSKSRPALAIKLLRSALRASKKDKTKNSSKGMKNSILFKK